MTPTCPHRRRYALLELGLACLLFGLLLTVALMTGAEELGAKDSIPYHSAATTGPLHIEFDSTDLGATCWRDRAGKRWPSGMMFNGVRQCPSVGGACVLPDGMGGPCDAPGAMDPDEYERLAQQGSRPESQGAWAKEKASDNLCYAEVYPKEFRLVNCGSHGARLVKARSPGPCYILHVGEVPCDTPWSLSKLEYDLLTRLPPEPQVQWLEWTIFVEGVGYQIGLRGDGVVVWRKKRE